MSAQSPTLLELFRQGYEPGEGAARETVEQTPPKDRNIVADFDTFARRLTTRLESEERDFDRLAYQEGVLNQKFYEGEFDGFFSRRTGEYISMPRDNQDQIYPHPKFRFFVDGIVAQHLLSEPECDLEPTSDEDHAVGAARIASRISKYFEEELLTHEFLLDEIKKRVMYKGSWRGTWWSSEAGGMVSRPRYEQITEKHGPDAFTCSNCGAAGLLDDLLPMKGGACPRCHQSSGVNPIPVPSVQKHTIVGYDEVPMGDLFCEAISPLEMKGDRRAGLYDRGLYVRRKRFVRNEVLADIIPWYNDARDDAAGSSSDDGIQAQEVARRPGRSGGRTLSYGAGGTTETRNVICEEWWLRKPMYWDVEFSKDVEFLNGDRIPARTRIGEVYPKGLFLLRANTKVMDHWEQDFRNHLLYTPFITLPHKPDGDSCKDLVEPQRERNDLKSFIFTYIKALAAPYTIIKPPLTESDFTGSPMTVTRLEGYRGPVADLIHADKAPPVDSSVFLYLHDLDADSQSYAKTMNINSGDPGSNDMGGTNTAHGMMILESNTQGLRGPELAVAAYNHARWIKQVLTLFRENAVDRRWIPFRGKVGEPEGEWFKGSDITNDFRIRVRMRSWVPRGDEQKRLDLVNGLSVGGGVVLNPQAPLALRRAIIERFNMNIDIDDSNLETRDARREIDEMTKMIRPAMALAQMLGSMEVAPQILSAMVPIDADMDSHPVYMQFYKEWVKGDEGRRAHPVLQQAVRVRFKERKELLPPPMGKPPSESLNYKDAPEDIRRQIEAQAGLTPSQIAEGAESGAQEAAQVQGKAALQQQKAELDEQRARADHERDQKAADLDSARRINEMTTKAIIDHSRAEAQPAPGDEHNG